MQMIRPRLNGLCALRDLYLLLNSTCVLEGPHYNGEMCPLILVRRLNVDRFQSFGESKFIKMCLASLKRNISLSGKFLAAVRLETNSLPSSQREGPDVTDNQPPGPSFANWKGRRRAGETCHGTESPRGEREKRRRRRKKIEHRVLAGVAGYRLKVSPPSPRGRKLSTMRDWLYDEMCGKRREREGRAVGALFLHSLPSFLSPMSLFPSYTDRRVS